MTKSGKLLEFCSKGGFFIYKVKSKFVRGKYIKLPKDAPNGEKLVLFKNKESYFLFTESEWEVLFNSIGKNQTGRTKRMLERSFSKRSKIVSIRKDDSLLIPSNLRD